MEDKNIKSMVKIMVEHIELIEKLNKLSKQIPDAQIVLLVSKGENLYSRHRIKEVSRQVMVESEGYISLFYYNEDLPGVYGKDDKVSPAIVIVTEADV